MIELKPCPFCGATDISKVTTLRHTEIVCRKCQATMMRGLAELNKLIANCGAKMDGGERMTYEEAIIILRDTPIDIRSSDDIYTLYATAQGMAIDALEKQIPKKPARTRGKYGHTECACCGWVVESFCGDLERYPFCPNCGYAIDWEVSE